MPVYREVFQGIDPIAWYTVWCKRRESNMNWLIDHLRKEARGRRFNPQDRVRYFTEGRKGKGRGVVLTPTFSKGVVLDFDSEKRQYRVKNNADEIIEVHPRNLIPDEILSRPVPITPEVTVVAPEEAVSEPR